MYIHVTLSHICATIVAVEKQYVLHILVGACSLRYPACHLSPVQHYSVFLIHGMIFRKKLPNIKCMF